ncbi:MAG: 2-C-methyl-D-erythritol 4-phosphate cytidylyltransferase [Gemmatimonadales bacterium]
MPRDVGVVVVAAGQGTRLGGEVPKQFRLIGGIPMLLRALRPFVAHPEVARVTVALPADIVAAPPAWLSAVAGEGCVLVAGGVERTDSAIAAVTALPSTCTIILVHDAARPFVERGLIDAVIARAREGRGAVPAIAVGDTLKQGADPSAGGQITSTVSRAGLWRAQTPQGFPRAMLERAYRLARERGGRATDDAALVEAAGDPVTLVPGSARNLKITTAEDLQLAECLATWRT